MAQVGRCRECGKKIPVGVAVEVEPGTGHHVMPEDPELDRICYGEFEIVEEES